MVYGINELTLKDKLLKKMTFCYANSNRSCFTWPKSETDAKMNFYAGIQTIEIFNVLFTWIRPYLLNIVYWTTPPKYRVTSTKIKEHSVTKRLKKLTQSDEFLLTLMRLSIRILNEDLADRFCISPALCSRKFTTWIRLLRQLLSCSLDSKRRNSTKFTRCV